MFSLLLSPLWYWFRAKISFVTSTFRAHPALVTFPSLNWLLPIYGFLPNQILQVPHPPIFFLNALGMFYLQILCGASWVGVVSPLTSIFVGTTSIVYQPPVILVNLWGISSQFSSGWTLLQATSLWLHNFKRFSMSPFLWMSLLSSHPPVSNGFALEGHWEYSSLICLLAAIHLVENHSVVYWQLLVSATLHLSVHKTSTIQCSYHNLPVLTQYKNFLHYFCHFQWHITPNVMPRHFCFLQWSIWCFQYTLIKEGQNGCMHGHTQMYINRICANSIYMQFILSFKYHACNAWG